jgi:hypothetical protein
MPLHRLKCKSVTLDEELAALAAFPDPQFPTTGQRLRELVSRLDTDFPDTDLWAFTSLGYLLLLPTPDLPSPGAITISAYGDFVIEYPLPKTIAPWKDARVCGRARDLETLLSYIRIAIARSQAWPSRAESGRREDCPPGSHTT